METNKEKPHSILAVPTFGKHASDKRCVPQKLTRQARALAFCELMLFRRGYRQGLHHVEKLEQYDARRHADHNVFHTSDWIEQTSQHASVTTPICLTSLSTLPGDTRYQEFIVLEDKPQNPAHVTSYPRQASVFIPPTPKLGVDMCRVYTEWCKEYLKTSTANNELPKVDPDNHQQQGHLFRSVPPIPMTIIILCGDTTAPARRAVKMLQKQYARKFHIEIFTFDDMSVDIMRYAFSRHVQIIDHTPAHVELLQHLQRRAKDLCQNLPKRSLTKDPISLYFHLRPGWLTMCPVYANGIKHVDLRVVAKTTFTNAITSTAHVVPSLQQSKGFAVKSGQKPGKKNRSAKSLTSSIFSGMPSSPGSDIEPDNNDNDTEEEGLLSTHDDEDGNHEEDDDEEAEGEEGGEEDEIDEYDGGEDEGDMMDFTD